MHDSCASPGTSSAVTIAIHPGEVSMLSVCVMLEYIFHWCLQKISWSLNASALLVYVSRCVRASAFFVQSICHAVRFRPRTSWELASGALDSTLVLWCVSDSSKQRSFRTYVIGSTLNRNGLQL